MEKAKMQVVRFNAEDVIATSALASGSKYWTSHTEWSQYTGEPAAASGVQKFLWDGSQAIGYTFIEGETNGDGYYAWYNNAEGTWGTDHQEFDYYGGNYPTGND